MLITTSQTAYYWKDIGNIVCKHVTMVYGWSEGVASGVAGGTGGEVVQPPREAESKGREINDKIWFSADKKIVNYWAK